MSRYQPYPSYKESWVEWLGEVPEHWEVTSLKYFYDSLDYKRIPISSVERADLSGDYPYYGASGIIDYVNDYIFDEETILVGEDGANLLMRSTSLAFIATGQYWVNNHAHILKFKDGLHSYWVYAINALDISPFVSGSAQPKLTAENLQNLTIAVPCTDEEKILIASFLDRETAKIDTLIAKQERMIELLGEKRSALISHAVTKGLDPQVKMKDSRVEWLGEVPEHWEIVQSRRLFAERKDRAQEGDEQLTASQKHGIVSQQEFMELEGRRVVQVITGSEILKRAKENDFVISMRSFQGGLEWCRRVGSMSSAYIALIPIKHVIPQFFAYLFKSKPYIQALQSTSNLVRDGQALRFENFSLVDLVIIPDEEQRAIADYLDVQTAKIDTLIAKARQAIELMKERRTALISAAVTGKIDVRGDTL